MTLASRAPTILTTGAAAAATSPRHPTTSTSQRHLHQPSTILTPNSSPTAPNSSYFIAAVNLTTTPPKITLISSKSFFPSRFLSSVAGAAAISIPQPIKIQNKHQSLNSQIRRHFSSGNKNFKMAQPQQYPTPLIPVERRDYDGKNMLRDPVNTVDPEIFALMQQEKARQRRGLQLIASENFTSRACNDALSSCLSNKYSEGYPGVRYYGGNEFIDQVETLCQNRALQVFGLDPEKWGVNVQPLSGSPANFAVYAAVAEQHGRIMGLELADGGHLTHGFFTPSKKVSATSIFYESMPYRVSTKTGLIDYDRLEENAMLFRPKIIIAGISCYTRWLDYARFRQIADKCGAYLMADMAHIAGLVAGEAAPSPFEYCDLVTTTTHKTLRGPRGALIFYRKGVRSVNAKGQPVLYDLGPKIDAMVFPGLQGGPHNHTIAAVAVALKQCQTTDFKQYARQVIKNAQALCEAFASRGYTLVTGGTDNHICLLDLRPNGLDAARLEVVLDMANITTNKNTCPGDKSALRPGGIRMGASSLTSRGFREPEFERVAEFIHRAVQIYEKYAGQMGKTQMEFKQFTASNEAFRSEMRSLGEEVSSFAEQFDLPGNDLF